MPKLKGEWYLTSENGAPLRDEEGRVKLFDHDEAFEIMLNESENGNVLYTYPIY